VQRLQRHSLQAATAALLAFSIASPATAVTVAEAVQTALERDPRYPLHQSTRSIGAGYREQAGSLLGGDPSLSLLAKSDELIGSDRGYQEYELGVSLPLWLPGQRGARRAIADSLDHQAAGELKLVAWEVTGKVLEQAWDLRLAIGAQQQARRQWDSAKGLERDIVRRVQAGESPRADRLMAQQETLNREAALDDAAAEVEHARLAWRSLTGLNELPVDLDRPAARPARSPAQSPPGSPNGLDPTHPRLMASMSETGTARAVRNDTRRNRRARPVLTFYAKRDRGLREDPYTNSIGAEISIPFGSGAHSAPGLAKAEAQLTSAQATLAVVERRIRLEQTQAERALEQAERRVKTAGRRDTLARSRVKLSRRAFELGESDLYPLLLARQQAADAALELGRSQLMIVRAAALYNHALGQTLGTLPR
jgi:outer membrane protein TolC